MLGAVTEVSPAMAVVDAAGRGRGAAVVAGDEVEPPGHLVADDLDALAREEADLEAALPAPPDGLVRRRHVDHRNHVANLEGKEKN